MSDLEAVEVADEAVGREVVLRGLAPLTPNLAFLPHVKDFNSKFRVKDSKFQDVPSKFGIFYPNDFLYWMSCPKIRGNALRFVVYSEFRVKFRVGPGSGRGCRRSSWPRGRPSPILETFTLNSEYTTLEFQGISAKFETFYRDVGP